MSLSHTRENPSQNLNHIPGNHYQNFSPTEGEPFLPPLEPGYQLVVEYECVCDYDAYDTGVEKRRDGCGVTFTRRISISPSGMSHNDRTHCKCSLEYLRGNIQDPKIFEREKAIFKAKVNRLFKDWDLLNQEVSRGMRFEKYKPGTQSQKEALKQLKDYTPDKGSICLAGHPGIGKTHLAIATANKMSYLGYSVLAVKSIDLLNRLRRCYNSKDYNLEVEIMDVLKKIDLLVIDDIGTEKPNDWVLAKFYEIIDTRADKKATIFTTNLDGESFALKLGPALRSRVYSSHIIIDGKDYRTFNNPFADWSDLGREVKR